MTTDNLTASEVAALRVFTVGEGSVNAGVMQSLYEKDYIYFTATETHITHTGRAALAAHVTPPAQAEAPADSEGAGVDDPLVVKYGDGYAAGYADGLKEYDAMQAELAALRNRVGVLTGVSKELARLTYEAEAFRAIAIIKRRECARAYDALGVEPIAADKRTKEYKEWQRANLASNNAWAEFNHMLRGIGLYVVSPSVVEALQAAAEALASGEG